MRPGFGVKLCGAVGIFCVASFVDAIAGERHEHRPLFSPDGSKIVFMSKSDKTADDWELFVMATDGRNRKRLTDYKGWDGYAVWSPDGQSLMFDRSLTGGMGDKAPHRLDLKTGKVSAIGKYEGWLSVTDWRDERLLAFWEKDGQRDLYILNANGEISRRLTDTPDMFEHGAHFSPDGTRAAFVSNPTMGKGPTALELIELSSGKRTKLHESKGRAYGVSWSPDGTSIAFNDAPGGEEDDADVFTIDIKSGEIKKIIGDDSWDHMPVWTPDGKAILFTSYRSGTEHIYVTHGSGAAMRLWAGDGE